MTREDIISMARQTGLGGYVEPQWDLTKELEDFAALVSAAAKAEEREACAKVCEAYTDNDGGTFIDHEGHGYACAAAIRARGETSSRGRA